MSESTEPVAEQVSPELAALVAANQTKLAELQAMGARPDPTSMLLARLEVALGLIFEQTPGMREEFSMRFENVMSENLDTMLRSMRRQRLMTPSVPSSGLIVPGR